MRSSSCRNWFFSKILSLITPVSKAMSPKLPKMTKVIKKHDKAGCSNIASWKGCKSGCAMSSNNVSMVRGTLPKAAARNSSEPP